ncbi:hypothetical protein BDY19DRAFT_981688 [Irpex rosettiformis]|uniref:Uncharacterized protein n=1 Tax=Irpex rosettiformis TaxID=378272 RepID=A0ACB8TLU5_9APHY|nr:hypothetical protein BDY19DRAFT_981688 [Irpex rosettiformis]
MVDVLEIRGSFIRISSPSDSNLLQPDNTTPDLSTCTINELDVDVLPLPFVSALKLSNINRGTITSLRVCLAKQTEFPCLGELIHVVGHSLRELSLDVRWTWTRWKKSIILGGMPSRRDLAPATLVSKALQEGFTTLTNLRKLHLTLLNRDFVYPSYIPNDPEEWVTMDEFERRVKIQAVHLIASIVEILPTPPPPSRDNTTDAQRPGLLTHFSAQITLATWSTAPPPSFIPIPSNFDWTVLQPAWTRLQSALDLHRDEYTSVFVSLTGGSEGDDVDEGQRGWRSVEEREG